METMNLDQLTETAVNDYIENCNLFKHERAVLNEILAAIKENDNDRLKWFASFGTDIRHIIMNVYAYRRGLDFGFTEISFDQYGWFTRPQFLEHDIIKFGETANYNTYSEIRIGRGINHVWTYTLNYSFGTAGGGSYISVYDRPYKDRETALKTALSELEEIMQLKVGNTDRSNYNPNVISATLKAITAYKYKDLQMTLF